MKKLLMLFMIVLSCCGCADTTELGDRAIIQLAAVDYADGQYKLSALLFSAGGSGGELDVTETNVIKVTGSGDTLGEAVKQLSLIDGKEIYMSEAKLIVLGGGFEQADIASVITMLHRDMRCSLNTPVCYSEKAELLTDLQFSEGITSAEKPVDMIENAFLSGESPKATVLDILADNAGGRNTLIPSFSETKNGSGMTKSEDGRTAVIDGAVFIENGKLSEKIDTAQASGYMLLAELADSVVLDITVDEKECSCEAYNIEVEWTNGRPKLSAYYRSRSGRYLTGEQELACRRKLNEIAEIGLEVYK